MTRTSRAAIVAALALLGALFTSPTISTPTTPVPAIAAQPARAAHSSVTLADATSASAVHAATGDDAIIVPGAADNTTFAHKSSGASASKARTQAKTADTNTPTTNGVETVYVSVASVTSKTSDDTNSGTSESDIKSLLAGINSYWAAQSEGAVSVVFGGYETRSLDASSCSPTDVLGSEETNAFGGRFANDAWIGTHDHLLVLTKEACGSQSFATVGGDGGEIFSGNGAGSLGLTYLLHEFGHNLGFEHADASTCENTSSFDAPISDFGFSSTTCPTTEYDDYLDIMGYTVKGATPNLSSPQQILAGWLTDYETATSSTPVETVKLSPLGGSSGTRALKIVDPSSDDVYYVEYRAPSGRDGTSAEFNYQRQCGSSHGGYEICNLGSSTSNGIVRILRELPFSGVGASGTTVEATGLVSGSKTKRETRMTTGQTFENYDDGFSVTLNSLSPSKGASVTVSFVHPVATTTTIAVDPGSQTYATDSPATADVTVTSADSDSTPAGDVTFYDGSTKLGSAPVDSDGDASFALSASLKVGTHQITAKFAPDSETSRASTSHAAAVKVAKAGSTVSFELASTAVVKNTADKATVTVDAAGVTSPTGTLEFYKDGKKWKSFTLSAKSNGVITVTLPKLSKSAQHSITLSYSGSSTVSSSKAGAQTVTVK